MEHYSEENVRLENLNRYLVVDWIKKRGIRRDHVDTWINSLLHILSNDSFQNSPPQCLRVPMGTSGEEQCISHYLLENLRIIPQVFYILYHSLTFPLDSPTLLIQCDLAEIQHQVCVCVFFFCVFLRQWNFGLFFSQTFVYFFSRRVLCIIHSTTPQTTHTHVPLTSELAVASRTSYGITLTADIEATNVFLQQSNPPDHISSKNTAKGVPITDIPSPIGIEVREDPGLEEVKNFQKKNKGASSWIDVRDARMKKAIRDQKLEYPFISTLPPPSLPIAFGDPHGLLVILGRLSVMKANLDSMWSMVRVSREISSSSARDPNLDMASGPNTTPRGTLVVFVNGHGADGFRITGCPIHINAEETANGANLGPITICLSRENTVKYRFPMALLFNALGVVDVESIIRYVQGVWDFEPPKIMSALYTSLGGYEFVTVVEALNKLRGYLETTLDVETVLYRMLLPHLGTNAMSIQAKLETIGNMIYMLLCEHASPGSFLTDINNQRNRRFITCGDLILNQVCIQNIGISVLCFAMIKRKY